MNIGIEQIYTWSHPIIIKTLGVFWVVHKILNYIRVICTN